MRAGRKIHYRLEWLGLEFATKFLPLLSLKVWLEKKTGLYINMRRAPEIHACLAQSRFAV